MGKLFHVQVHVAYCFTQNQRNCQKQKIRLNTHRVCSLIQPYVRETTCNAICLLW
jgi:hypothetical protein